MRWVGVSGNVDFYDAEHERRGEIGGEEWKLVPMHNEMADHIHPRVILDLYAILGQARVASRRTYDD